MKEQEVKVRDKKPWNSQGLIIAAYPGMGQNMYSEVYDTYKHLSVYDGFIGKSKRWEQRYINTAIGLVTNGGVDVCFVDVHTDVLKYLDELGYPFLIFYPGTSQESILKLLATFYQKKPTIGAGRTIADVILNHDNKIAELRQYNNSIMSNTGLIKEEVLDRLLDMDYRTRTNTMVAMSKIKMQKMKQKEGSSDAVQVN